MIDEKLRIFIPTYNRAAFLDATLSALEKSPFAGCRVTVLDNCSADATAEVCRSHMRNNARLDVLRHAKNIGANPNYLRAVELSDGEYTWVLCDDDTYDFSGCGGLLAALEEGKADLFLTGPVRGSEGSRGRITGARELIDGGVDYFFGGAFWPGLIFRTSLFDSACLILGYHNVTNLIPGFPFLHKAAADNFSVYLPQKQMVFRGGLTEESTPKGDLLISWLRSCELIDDARLRAEAQYSIFRGKSALEITKVAGTAKIAGRPIPLRVYRDAFLGLDAARWSRLMPSLLIMPLPGFLLRRLKMLFRFFKYTLPGKKEPPFMDNAPGRRPPHLDSKKPF